MTTTNQEIIRNYQGPPIRIMEVCGTHTHEIFRLGLRSLLPSQVNLISGPGCPVCVTPCGYIDEAIALAVEHQAVICTFGDLIRVPGSKQSLAGARSQGAVVKPVYSPMDAVEYAAANPQQQVVFLAVGFETTVPSACLAVRHAQRQQVKNFSILGSNKTMPQAYQALAGSADVFIYPGHVHTIIGTGLCQELCQNHGVSGVVAGFTASELLEAFAAILTAFPAGKPFFQNCYPRVVRPEGNPAAVKLIEAMMEPCDAQWRGLGVIPGSGLQLKEEFHSFDARRRFNLPVIQGQENPGCRCGSVLQGKCRPSDCPLFGKACTPAHPIGACMVSGEGSCSAYYQYGDFNHG